MADLTDLVSSQLLFLNSNPSQTYQQFTFDTSCMTCNNDEHLSISLQQVCFNRNDSYIINETNNSFTFVRVADGSQTVVSIEPGCYTYDDFALAVSRSFAGVKCIFLRPQKKYQFHFSEPYSLHFPDLKTANIFGFNTTQSVSGSSIVSTQILDYRFNINNIAIHLTGITFKSRNQDNFFANDPAPSNIIALIPWSLSRPFESFNHVVQNPQEYILCDDNISTLWISISDLNGNFQSQINDWTMVLRVNCYKRKEDVLMNSMRQLLNFKKFSFMKKNMLERV